MTDNNAIKPGDRLLLSGGYDFSPRWLCGRQSHIGTVVGLLPGQGEQSAVLLKLDAPIEVDGISGDFLVLETRYAGKIWADKGIVHVELCDFEPDPEMAGSAPRQVGGISCHV